VIAYLAKPSVSNFLIKAKDVNIFAAVSTSVVKHNMKFLLNRGEHLRAWLQDSYNLRVGFAQQICEFRDWVSPVCKIGPEVWSAHERNRHGAFKQVFCMLLSRAARDKKCLPCCINGQLLYISVCDSPAQRLIHQGCAQRRLQGEGSIT
jgi:hypothetical protein